LAREDVEALLGASGSPVLTRVSRYPAAMPQYAVGHLDRVLAIERHLAAWPGLRLAGAAFRGVGIAGCGRSGGAARRAPPGRRGGRLSGARWRPREPWWPAPRTRPGPGYPLDFRPAPEENEPPVPCGTNT